LAQAPRDTCDRGETLPQNAVPTNARGRRPHGGQRRQLQGRGAGLPSPCLQRANLKEFRCQWSSQQDQRRAWPLFTLRDLLESSALCPVAVGYNEPAAGAEIRGASKSQTRSVMIFATGGRSCPKFTLA